MSLLVDCRALQTGSAVRGIGRYVNQLVRVLGEEEQTRFLFFAGKAPAWDPAMLGRRVLTPSPRRMITWSDSFFLPRVFSRSGVTCYHSTAFGLPKRVPKIRYLMTVFDLTPLLFPHLCSCRLRLVFKRIVQSAQRADLIITISKRTATDLQKFVTIPDDRIVTVYNFLDPLPASQEEATPARSLPESFLLYVGGADRSKNLETLLTAVTRLQIPLVVVGAITMARRKELLLPLAERDHHLISFTGYIPDAELNFLYRKAKALALPSLNEGFGYPPLEALRHGTPVLVSKAGALPEILEDAALYVERVQDPNEWQTKISELLSNTTLREQLLAKGKLLLPRYEPQKIARQWSRIYRLSDSGEIF